MRESARDKCRREAARSELARQPRALVWSIAEDERLVEGHPVEQLEDLSTPRRRERLRRALTLAVLLRNPFVRAAAPDDAVVLSDAGKGSTSDELRRFSWYAAGRRAVGGASASCPFALGRLAAEAQRAIEEAEWIARVVLVRGWRERRQQRDPVGRAHRGLQRREQGRWVSGGKGERLPSLGQARQQVAQLLLEAGVAA